MNRIGNNVKNKNVLAQMFQNFMFFSVPCIFEITERKRISTTTITTKVYSNFVLADMSNASLNFCIHLFSKYGAEKKLQEILILLSLFSLESLLINYV